MATTESVIVEQGPGEEPAEASPRTKRKSQADDIEVDLDAPEPPSKRARRALKKGKPLPPKPDSDDEDAAKDKKDKKDKTRSEHGVWIGNLPFTATPALVRGWLLERSGGAIVDEAVTRVKVPTTKPPKDHGREKSEKPANKGFAYVDFADVGAKVAAMALSETEFGGRRVLIKDSTSFEGRPQKEKEATDAEAKAEAKDQNASSKIFVGNMSFKTTEDDLRRNFEKCGEIDWAKLATFEDTGKCKGYGWVKFREPEAAAWAVKGFVKIKEEVETEDDFREKEDGSDDEEPREKQFKTRKWWVNRMLGRELKLELAEDDQLRYRKRFGKDAPKKLEGQGARPGRTPRSGRAARDDPDAERDGVKPMKVASDIQVARLTGAVVEHTGTKMTFE